MLDIPPRSGDKGGGEVGMTENELLEKVIKGLETSLSIGVCGKCVNECWYGDTIASCHDIIQDALALLKAHESRLVEPNDFENADDYNWLPAWCEERTGAGYWEMILPDALDEKDVRYWTGRPTDEQRAKEPWNGQA